MSPADRWRLLLPLSLILGLAAALRVSALSWSLPGDLHLFSYHPDEYHSLRGFLSLVLAGDLNPHFFNYGSLYLYLLSAAVLLLHPGASLTAWAEGLAGGEAGPLLGVWTVSGRLVSAVAGVLLVYVVFLLGRRLVDQRAGLIAAALMAVAPLSVLLSHYATVEATQALFIALALYLSVVLVERPDRRTLLWAGACAGLAASTKYNGAAVLVAPLLASCLAPLTPPGKGFAGVWLRRWVLLGAAAVVAFAVTSPYTFLAWEEAREAIRFEAEHMRVGEALAVAADPSALGFHLRHLLYLGLGPALFLSLVGAATLPWVGSRGQRRAWYPVVAFALLWLVMICLANVRYPRYELPLVAPLILLGLAPLRAWPRHTAVWQVALLTGLACALVISLVVVTGLRQPRPQEEALEYVLATTVRTEPVGLMEEPWFPDPPLDYCNGGRVLRASPLWSRYRTPLRPLVVSGLELSRLDSLPRVFATNNFTLGDGVRAADPRHLRFREELERHYRPLRVFGGDPFPWIDWTPGHDWRYAWPEITVWMRITGREPAS